MLEHPRWAVRGLDMWERMEGNRDVQPDASHPPQDSSPSPITVLGSDTRRFNSSRRKRSKSETSWPLKNMRGDESGLGKLECL